MRAGTLVFDISYNPIHFDSVLPSERRITIRPVLVCKESKPVNYDKVFVHGETGPLNSNGSRLWIYMKAPCPMPYWGNPDLCWKVIATSEDFPQDIIDDIAKGKIKEGDSVVF